MSLKQKLIAIRNTIKESKTVCFVNPDNEFDVELENHKIGNQNIYRLYYINYHRIGMLGHSDNRSNIGLINWPCKPFMLPDGMSREEGFKVLSYLTDFIEKRDDIEPGSLKSVNTLDSVLNLERFGFKRVDETDEDKILNLFTVDGRTLLFKRSEYYKKYFEWYTENVTKEEVEKIYSKIGIEFKDIVWSDNKKNQNEISGQSNEKTKQYIEKFYEPVFSPYDFMCLYGALNASQNNLSFSRDNLVNFISICKKNDSFNRLLKDIHIKNNGVFNFSEDLDEAILKLKLGGIFYTISPETDSTMMIFNNIPISELIKNRINYFDDMVNFIKSYRQYELEIINQAYKRFYDQERRDLENISSGLKKSRDK